MPFFTYRCDACSLTERRLVEAGDRDRPAPCSVCAGIVKRVRVADVGVSKVERLDNGVMAKSVERFSDAERLHHDRAVSHDREMTKGPEIVR